jgi:hypothetical protein
MKKLISLAMTLWFAGCATNPAVDHNFAYGYSGDNKNVEILFYKYGDDAKLPLSPSPEDLKAGKIGQGGTVSGKFKPGEFLIVKWKRTDTQELFEEKVRLLGMLPDLKNKTLYFSIQQDRLYVASMLFVLHAEGKMDCPIKIFAQYQCKLVSPFVQQNY